MVRLLFLLLAASVAQAAVTVTALVVAPTHAVIAIRGASGTCTLNLYEGAAASGTAHPDVSAVSDSSLLVTTWRDNTRVVQLGHKYSNRALAADTQYTGAVSGCGTATFTFRTPPPSQSSAFTRPPKWSASTWNNADVPQIDWASTGRGQKYVDPMTGIKLELLQHQGAIAWRQANPEAFTAYLGGTGWTNPANAIAGGTSSFGTTSNTNPIDLFPDSGSNKVFGAVWGNSSNNNYLENIGIVVYGSGDSATAADRTISISIVRDPAIGPDGTAFDVVLPQGSTNPASVAQVQSSSTDASKAWPSSYPTEGFSGWGGSRITMADWPVTSTSSITSGVATIASPSGTNHFPSTLVSGSYIKLSGVGCTNNLCAISALNSAKQITLSDTGIASASISGTSYPFFIRAWKKNATGQVSVGFRLVGAGTQGAKTAAEGIQCHPVSTTDYQGKSGHFCGIYNGDSSTRSWYFVRTEDNTAYYVTNFPTNRASASIAVSNDRPSGAVTFAKAPMGFGSDGRTFYTAMNSNAGVMSIFRIVLPAPTPGYLGNVIGANQSPLAALASDGSTWTNMTASNPIATQIATNFPEYNSAVWGTTFTSGGFSGDMAFLYTISGQDASPCHLAVVHIPTSTVVKMFSTMEGNVGGIPEVRWGTCHSIAASKSIPNTVELATNHPRANDSTKPMSGPFGMSVTAVKKSGVWSSNTSLPWPIDNTYDNTCPAGLPADIVDRGAVEGSNQCVQLEFSGQPCNMVNSATATAAFPACSWNASYTQPISLRVGDRITWVHASSTNCKTGQSDCEYFQVASIDSLSPLRVTALRNATWDYVCAGRTSFCQWQTDQYQPLNGWTAYMISGTSNSSRNATYYITFSADGSYQLAELPNSLNGHSASGAGPRTGITFVSGQYVFANTTLSGLNVKYPPSATFPNTDPKFNGVKQEGFVQQYMNRAHVAASARDLGWTLDTNVVNPSGGSFSENLNNSYSRSLSAVGGYTDIYLVGVIGTVDYKRRPLIGWAGRHMLEDISSPTADLTAAHDYSLCHTYRSGVTCGISGATTGQTYVRVPKALVQSTCPSGISWANVPCVMSSTPNLGGVRRFWTDSPNVNGAGSQTLTYGLLPPGMHYPYTQAAVGPTGTFAIMMGGHTHEGIRPVQWLISLPSWRQKYEPNKADDGSTAQVGITVQVPSVSGATGARIRWGYDSSFRCTAASEACLTDSSVRPFVFAGETSTPTSCSSGCSITIPAGSADDVVWYQVEWMSGGSVVKTSDVIPAIR